VPDSVPAYTYLARVAASIGGFQSKERPGNMASNSEIRRWLTNHSVVINGQTPGPKDLITYPVLELVLYPKKPGRVTIR